MKIEHTCYEKQHILRQTDTLPSVQHMNCNLKWFVPLRALDSNMWVKLTVLV